MKKCWPVSVKVFWRIILCKNNRKKQYRKRRIRLEIQLNKIYYNVYRFTLTDSNLLFIIMFRRIFFSIQIHYVLKRMRKSITLGFPLVYCGTFIIYKWKKVLLKFTHWLLPLAPINIEWKLVPLVFSVIFHWGVDQNLERRNVERSVFRNFKIANTEMTKWRKLFDGFIIEFFFFIFHKLFEEPKYFVIISNCKILIFQMVK